MWHIQYNLSQSVVTAESIASRQLPRSPKLSGFKGHDTLTLCLVDTNQGVQACTLHIRCGRQFLKKSRHMYSYQHPSHALFSSNSKISQLSHCDCFFWSIAEYNKNIASCDLIICLNCLFGNHRWSLNPQNCDCMFCFQTETSSSCTYTVEFLKQNKGHIGYVSMCLFIFFSMCLFWLIVCNRLRNIVSINFVFWVFIRYSV